MNPESAVIKYIADSLPYYGLLALGYFVVLALMAKGGVKSNWKGNVEVALLAAFFHALTISSYYQYMNLPRLPLPATTLSAPQVFVITAMGLFVTLALTNLAARGLAVVLGFGKEAPRASRPAVSMAAVTKKKRRQQQRPEQSMFEAE
jgi:hypothetical protein